MEVRFTRHFKKNYKKSPIAIQKSFDARLEIFLSDPNNYVLHNHSLRGNLAGSFTINVTNDWRAVYTLDNGIIVFIALGTHSQLYG
ncbi:MAG: type II toxin-antitoxin system mRNA interferase toxin, RelE/StbE family [Candidatus Buchananbacteria bacterium]|jgi:addiction module RelE/StbE family toxin